MNALKVKSRGNFASVIAGSVCLASSSSFAQTVPGSFAQLQQALGETAVAKPRQGLILDRIAEDTLALQTVAPQIRSADRVEFARSLNYNAWLVDQAANEDEAEAADILADVADDLEVKRLAVSTSGTAAAFTGRVHVRVVTLRNGLPAPGYIVTLNPIRWVSREPMYRLPTLSPAAGDVPPGRYEIAAIRQDSVQAKGVFRVGLAAEDEVSIELPVP